MLSQKQIEQNEEMLGTVLPEVAQLARKILAAMAAKGIHLLIPRTGGYRDSTMQDKISTDPSHSKAKGGWSWHNYRRALDFVVITDGNECDWRDIADSNHDDKKDYDQLGECAKTFGFVWGGDWTHFKDYGHIEYHPGITLAQARAAAGLT